MRLNTKNAEYYLSLIDEYKLAHGVTQYYLADVVSWALTNDRLEMSPGEVREFHLAQMSGAANADGFKDKDGRKIRRRYCVRVDVTGNKQKFLWSDVEDASVDFLYQAVDQMREQIAADISAFRANVDYINEVLRRRGLRPVQPSFDFTIDSGDGKSLSA